MFVRKATTQELGFVKSQVEAAIDAIRTLDTSMDARDTRLRGLESDLSALVADLDDQMNPPAEPTDPLAPSVE